MTLIISHRGNINGPDPLWENEPSYIQAARKLFDVEIDVWYVNGKWMLGHDEPTYEVDLEFIQQPKLWCHAKNFEAFVEMQDRVQHFFWHQEDDYAMTSSGFIWTYPGKLLSPMSIAVMPEKVNGWVIDKHVFGICTDHVETYHNLSLKFTA